jgi:hypothetical protein
MHREHFLLYQLLFVNLRHKGLILTILGANAAWCEANHTVYLKVGMGSLDIFE